MGVAMRAMPKAPLRSIAACILCQLVINKLIAIQVCVLQPLRGRQCTLVGVVGETATAPARRRHLRAPRQ